MDGVESRFNPSSIIAACIVAIGLVASALIVAHRPQASAASTLSAKSGTAPPFTQQSVSRQQFRTQLLASPDLHTVHVGGVTATLTDVAVSQVVYSPKDDTFTILFGYVWQPDVSANAAVGSDPVLSNDGYGYYSWTVDFNNGAIVPVTLK